MQPYYAIGQWRLPTGRLLRAFVCSRQGSLHIIRVAGDRGELTADERNDCYRRVFPDLLSRLQRFGREIPGVLKHPALASDLPSVSSTDLGPTFDSQHRAAVPPARRFGELLVQENVITPAQLHVALRYQALSRTYVPIGQALLAQRLITRKKLQALLHHHGKWPRLGEVLLKAGHITTGQLEEALAYQQRTAMPVGQALIRLGCLSELAMRDALCTQLQVNFLDLDPVVIDKNLAQLVSERFATRYSLAPVLRVDDVLVVAMDDPSQADVIARLETGLGLQIETVMTTAAKLEAGLHRLYTSTGPSDGQATAARNIFIGSIRDDVVAELVIRRLWGLGIVPVGSQRFEPAVKDANHEAGEAIALAM